jgi:uncharacterized protein (DUF433 family)
MYLERPAPDVIKLKGHRIGLEHIVERFWQGMSPEQIALDFPGVGLPVIYTTLAYYLHNKAEVDAYITRINAEAERQYQAWLVDPNGGQSALSQRMRALKASRDAARSPQQDPT